MELMKDVVRDLSQNQENEAALQQMQMKTFFCENGGQIVKQYVQAMLRVPPRTVSELYCDVIVVLCDSFRFENDLPTIWLTLAMDEVPISVFT